MRSALSVAVVASVLGAGLWAAPPATGVVGPLALRVTPAGGPSGALATVTGEDAAPGAPVRLELRDTAGTVLVLTETTADDSGAFRSALLLPERGPSQLQVRGCASRPGRSADGCQREGRVPLAHHGSPALVGDAGHRAVALRLERFADPASCGPVVLRRAGERGAPVDLQQARDGTWSGRLDVAAPPGRWTFSATQDDEGCDVRASTSSLSRGLRTDPEQPRAGERLLVHGAAFEQECPALEVVLAGEPLGPARLDGDGAFALPARAPTEPGRYELSASRPESERCGSFRLTEAVRVGPGRAASPTDTSRGASTAPGRSATSSPAAPAGIPSVSVDAAAGGVLPVTGLAWAPGEDVVLALDGERVARSPAGPDGSLVTTLLAPEGGGQHLLTACQRCDGPLPLLARVAFELPAPRRGPHPALALVLLVPAAALPAHRRRQRRLARRASLLRRPAALRSRLQPLSGPPARAVRLVPRSAPPDARLRRGPP